MSEKAKDDGCGCLVLIILVVVVISLLDRVSHLEKANEKPAEQMHQQERE